MLNETAHKILDVAEDYTRIRGFNAFSYKDIQHDLGIKTSSIHYYFPTKGDLAEKMIERYIERYKSSLQEIKDKPCSAINKLQALAKIFITSAKEEKFCLCGMLASDLLALPSSLQQYLNIFFDLNESWIADVLKQGIADKEINSSINCKGYAALFFSMLEGGLLVTRARNNISYLEKLVKQAIQQIKQ